MTFPVVNYYIKERYGIFTNTKIIILTDVTESVIDILQGHTHTNILYCMDNIWEVNLMT